MPVEFALRPRIQLREAAPKPRRGRARLPRFALPAVAYWLAMGGLTYAYVHFHRSPEALASPETAQLAEPEREAPRAWWRRTPTSPTAEGSSPTAGEASATPEPALVPPAMPATEPEPAALPEVAAEPTPEPASASLPMRSRTVAAAPELPHAQPSNPAEAPPLPEHAALPQLALRSPLDVLDEPRPAAPATPPATPAPDNTRVSGSLPSCEQAIASAHQDIDFSGGNGTADLPTNVIAAVLENGVWLSSCDVPASTTLDVCVAIRGGNVIGASVTARPQNPEVAACVRRRASGLQFPYSSHVDIARTRF